MSNRTISLDEDLYDYLLAVSLRESSLMRRLREETALLPMSAMQIAPEQGQFMALLVRLMNARRCLEVGVFTGYSSLAVATALPEDGRLVACDVSEEWTQIARRYWREASVDGKIELHLAPAVETLDRLIAEAHEPFDFAFIDADKTSYLDYYERCLELLRPGGLIVIDNVLWSGWVIDPDVHDEDTQAIRRFNEFVKTDDRVESSMVPVGDGLTLARKKNG